MTKSHQTHINLLRTRFGSQKLDKIVILYKTIFTGIKKVLSQKQIIIIMASTIITITINKNIEFQALLNTSPLGSSNAIFLKNCVRTHRYF